MKTEDLWIPFTFENRKPVILNNNFLLIPRNYTLHEDFTLPHFAGIFQNDNPVYIEYCSGNGQWICQKASDFPNINWIAVEKRFDRAKKIWSRAKKSDLSNVFVVFGDAYTFSEKYLSKDSIDKVFINFPDPWPKQKHAKNRLIQHDFIGTVSTILKKDENMVVVTDHNKYSSQIINTFLKHPSWESCFEEPFFTLSWPNYGGSYFNDLFFEMGKNIFYMQFQNKK